MAKRSKIAVFLTAEARNLLAGEVTFQLLLQDDSYLNCESAEQNGEFIDLEVNQLHPTLKKTIKAKISIPGRFVLYMLSFQSDAALGFKLDEFLSNPPS
jgi:hypothetical protein